MVTCLLHHQQYLWVQILSIHVKARQHGSYLLSGSSSEITGSCFCWPSASTHVSTDERIKSWVSISPNLYTQTSYTPTHTHINSKNTASDVVVYTCNPRPGRPRKGEQVSKANRFYLVSIGQAVSDIRRPCQEKALSYSRDSCTFSCSACLSPETWGWKST